MINVFANPFRWNDFIAAANSSREQLSGMAIMGNYKETIWLCREKHIVLQIIHSVDYIFSMKIYGMAFSSLFAFPSRG